MVALFIIAMFFCLPLTSLPSVDAQQTLASLSTDREIYPIWRIGGNVNVTLTNLASNSTYFLWLQRPSDNASNLINVGISGRQASQVFQLRISTTDPPGTYLVSLSSSNVVDTRIAVAHFGVFGIDQDTYQRTESVLASGGGVYPNSTVSLTLTYESGAATTINVNASSRGNLQYSFAIPANAPLGQITVTASGTSLDSKRSVSVEVQASITLASINFLGEMPPQVQRTMTEVFNVTLVYPNGTLLAPDQLLSNPNLTITILGYAQTFLLNNSLGTDSWSYSYFIPVNATLGTYSYSLGAEDLFDNPAVSTGIFSVQPAKFIIDVPQPPSKVRPQQVIDIAIYVFYPNGTSLTNVQGNVTSIYEDTHGNNATVPLIFNATDGRWHLLFAAPSQGFTFGIILTFSFNAIDIYKNSGAANNAYVLTVGATPTQVILAGIAGAIVPIALLIWALVTISKKKRQHKP
jgi:hypothetical protein